MKFKAILTALFLFIIVTSVSAQAKLKTGIWRGALKNSAGFELPFNFEVTNIAGAEQLTIINGAERFKVTDVKTKGDSVFIRMPLFDSEFRLKQEAGMLKGVWIRHLGDHDSQMEFTAQHGVAYRFKADEKPAFDITGRWSTTFGDGTAGKEKLVGEFKQTGAKLTGTFLSTTGDYRYLEGSVTGDKIYMSCFDGGHAYLFMAKISDAKTITEGNYYAGLTSHDIWKAVKDPNAKLPDAYSLTALKPGYKTIAFSFKDSNGKTVSLTDAKYKNKVVIVQILGSWCPNCMDETNFLVSNYYKKYHPKGVEVIGLAYERTTDFAKSQKTLQQLKSRFHVPYPLLITGYTNAKGEPEKSLPMMAKVVGFPTTIIIDKKGDVRKIHTGFSGPGTGKYYTEFIEEFDNLTNDLLAEK